MRRRSDAIRAISGRSAPDTGRLANLERIWKDPSGFWGWFTHVNHRSIGKRYMVTAFAFFLRAECWPR